MRFLRRVPYDVTLQSDVTYKVLLVTYVNPTCTPTFCGVRLRMDGVLPWSCVTSFGGTWCLCVCFVVLLAPIIQAFDSLSITCIHRHDTTRPGAPSSMRSSLRSTFLGRRALALLGRRALLWRRAVLARRSWWAWMCAGRCQRFQRSWWSWMWMWSRRRRVLSSPWWGRTPRADSTHVLVMTYRRRKRRRRRTCFGF